MSFVGSGMFTSKGSSSSSNLLDSPLIQAHRELYDSDKESSRSHPQYHEHWKDGRNSSVLHGVFNLVGTIISGGVLSLPYALMRSGLVVYLILLVVSVITTDWSAYVLISCARRTGGRTFKEVAEILYGPIVGDLVNISLFSITLMFPIANGILLRDIVPPILSVFQIIPDDDDHEKYHNAIMVCCILLILPLCLQKTLYALRFTSAFSMIAIATLAICFTYHASYSNAGNSRLHLIKYFPTSFGDCLYIFPIFCASLICNFNVLPLYVDLIEPSRKRIKTLIHTALSICGGLYLFCTIAGYVIYYDETQDNIFKNFPDDDIPITIGRIVLTITLLLAYPLMILPSRDNLIELGVSIYNRKREESQKVILQGRTELIVRVTTALILVGVALSISISVASVVVVWNVMGATIGILVSYVLPPLFYIKIRGPGLDSSMTIPVWCLLIFGIVALILCSYETFSTL